jgi:anaerobic selenocysteine-containing dehydrogenase
MDDLSRREFLRKGSVGAAAGAFAIGLGSEGLAKAATRSDAKATKVDPREATTDEPIVAYVKRGTHGEVHVMVGSREVVHKDADLARRIIRASKH